MAIGGVDVALTVGAVHEPPLPRRLLHDDDLFETKLVQLARQRVGHAAPCVRQAALASFQTERRAAEIREPPNVRQTDSLAVGLM